MLLVDDVQAYPMVTLAVGPSFVAKTEPSVRPGGLAARGARDGRPGVLFPQVEAVSQANAFATGTLDPKAAAAAGGWPLRVIGDEGGGQGSGWGRWGVVLPPFVPGRLHSPLDLGDGGDPEVSGEELLKEVRSVAGGDGGEPRVDPVLLGVIPEGRRPDTREMGVDAIFWVFVVWQFAVGEKVSAIGGDPSVGHLQED